MWRSPIEVSTEFGPTTGTSGELGVTDGASAGLAVNSERTWSGWLTTAAGSSSTSVSIRNVSPSSRRARNMNSTWRTLMRKVCNARGRRTDGGAGSDSASPLAGPACEGAASGGASPDAPAFLVTLVTVISPLLLEIPLPGVRQTYGPQPS